MVLKEISALLLLGVTTMYFVYKRMKAQKQIGVKNVNLSEYEMSIAAHLVDPLSMQIKWSDIAGLDDVITELKDTVILPIQKRHLFENSRLLQPPKGVLLYGPPGCGKTLIVKATAKEAGICFINLQPSTLMDKWYGESQKLAAAVFSLAIKLQPTIIFIDEIDSFLRSRSSSDHETTAMMKAQFMSLWDGLNTDFNCQVIIMGATNRPQDLDSAILRRMPTCFHINLPNLKQREEILRLILDNENVEDLVDLVEVAKETDGFSGSDLRETCRDAALTCVRDFVHNNEKNRAEDYIRPIQQQDLQRAIQKMRKSKRAASQNILNLKQREEILRLILDNENVEDLADLIEVAKETDGFSGSDLWETCQDAALTCVRDFVHNNEENRAEEDYIQPIQQQDLQRAIQKMRKSKMAGTQNILVHAALD